MNILKIKENSINLILTNFIILKKIILFLFNIIIFFRKEYIFFCLLTQQQNVCSQMVPMSFP